MSGSTGRRQKQQESLEFAFQPLLFSTLILSPQAHRTFSIIHPCRSLLCSQSGSGRLGIGLIFPLCQPQGHNNQNKARRQLRDAQALPKESGSGLLALARWQTVCLSRFVAVAVIQDSSVHAFPSMHPCCRHTPLHEVQRNGCPLVW